jgi:hypothetical protein
MVTTTQFVGQFITFFFMISFWSLVVKENIAYRFVTNIYIGLSMGNFFVMAIKYLASNTFPKITSGAAIDLIIPVILGFLLWTTLYQPLGYLARWGTAIMLGAGTALSMQGQLASDLMTQLVATIKLDPTNINSILIWIMVIASMSYFIYTFTQKHILGEGYLPKFGRIILMTTFGARYANALMSRVGVGYPMLRDHVIYFIMKVLGLRPW